MKYYKDPQGVICKTNGVQTLTVYPDTSFTFGINIQDFANPNMGWVEGDYEKEFTQMLGMELIKLISFQSR